MKVNHMFCQDCFCLQNYPLQEGCFFASVVGNGICDDLANTEECSYDGGTYIRGPGFARNLLKFYTRAPIYVGIFHKKFQPIISKGSEVIEDFCLVTLIY